MFTPAGPLHAAVGPTGQWQEHAAQSSGQQAEGLQQAGGAGSGIAMRRWRQSAKAVDGCGHVCIENRLAVNGQALRVQWQPTYQQVEAIYGLCLPTNCVLSCAMPCCAMLCHAMLWCDVVKRAGVWRCAVQRPQQRRVCGGAHHGLC